MPRHKHCEQCGLDFEPKQAWEKYCSPTCLNDHMKTNPTIPNPYNPTITPGFGWPMPAPMYTPDYYCGLCGQKIPPNEPHIHTFTVTSTGPSSNGNP